MHKLLPATALAALVTAVLAGCAMMPNSSDVDAAKAAEGATGATSTASAAPAPTLQDQQAYANCISYAQVQEQDLTFGPFTNERVLDVPGQGRSIIAPVATVSGVSDMYATYTCQIDGSANSTVLSGSLSDAH